MAEEVKGMAEEASVQKVQDRAQLVVFQLGTESYGVDIQRAREIVRVPQVTRVPRAPEFIEGIMNLRGTIIPVIDLRRRFGLGRSEERSENARIIVVEMGDQTVGMIVDAVSEVLYLEADQIEPPSPYMTGVDARFITGVGNLGDRLIILIDLEKVLSFEERERLQEVAAEAEGE